MDRKQLLAFPKLKVTLMLNFAEKPHLELTFNGSVSAPPSVRAARLVSIKLRLPFAGSLVMDRAGVPDTLQIAATPQQTGCFSEQQQLLRSHSLHHDLRERRRWLVILAHQSQSFRFWDERVPKGCFSAAAVLIASLVLTCLPWQS